MKIRINESGSVSIVGTPAEIFDLLQYAQDGAHFNGGQAIDTWSRQPYKEDGALFQELYEKLQERLLVKEDGQK